jgi:methionine-rich copper-binding protein CopC
VTAFSPAKNAKNVAPDVSIVMTFNEEVQAGSGLITLNQGGSSQTIGVGSSDVAISGKTVTITPASPLPRGVDVAVQMPAGAFRDLKGNAYGGLTGAAWSFSVASTATRTDNTAPEVTAYTPALNARDVAVNTNLIITFSEEVRKGNGFITIGQGRNSQTINVNTDAVAVNGNTVTINPPANFPEGARITVQMPRGVFVDASGNEFGGIASADTWAFNTVPPSPQAPPPTNDNQPPFVLQVSPPDNTTGVPNNTNLVMTFSENVFKGQGTILISYPGTQLTVDVTSPAVTVADNTVTIDPPGDFPVGAAVNVQMPAGTFLDAEGNPFTGINNPSIWNFRIYSPADDLAPLRIVSTEFPDVINDNAASTEAAVRVSNMPPGTTAELVYRGIAEANWSRVPANVNSDNLRISAALPQAVVRRDRPRILLRNPVFTTIRIFSDRGYTYRNYTANGLPIPNLRFGNTAADYQIISIPLMLKDPSVATTLEDNLGDYNPRKWRLFAYRNSVLQEYEQGFTTVDPNQGYWLIMKDQRDVATGEGSTHRVYQESPYVMRLQKGWNQIGNPYNFNVVWSDVKAYNRSPAGLGGLRVFDRGFQNTDTLKRFRGAFVFAETGHDDQPARAQKQGRQRGPRGGGPQCQPHHPGRTRRRGPGLAGQL